MKPIITTGNGRALDLQWIRQHRVYEGLLEGLPTEAMNRRHIEHVLQQAKSAEGAPHLIEPIQRPIPYDGVYPFGMPMALPEVAVIAHFRSLAPARDAHADGSSLVVVWFQDAFALPIAPEVVARLMELPWEALAHDWEY